MLQKYTIIYTKQRVYDFFIHFMRSIFEKTAIYSSFYSTKSIIYGHFWKKIKGVQRS